MSVHVKFSSSFKKLLNGKVHFNVNSAKIIDAIHDIDAIHPGVRDRLLDSEGNLLRFVNIFVNEKDTRGSDILNRKLKSGDTVTFLQAFSGG